MLVGLLLKTITQIYERSSQETAVVNYKNVSIMFWFKHSFGAFSKKLPSQKSWEWEKLHSINKVSVKSFDLSVYVSVWWQ